MTCSHISALDLRDLIAMNSKHLPIKEKESLVAYNSRDKSDAFVIDAVNPPIDKSGIYTMNIDLSSIMK